MKPAMELLLQRPTNLVLTTGEVYPPQQGLENELEGTEMEGVEHLGQYVCEMTQAKVKSLGGKVAVGEEEGRRKGLMDMRRMVKEREDPLHESVSYR